jgi:hypothetical protein
MADDKKNHEAQDSKTADEAATTTAVPFPKIMSKLMAWCGCRPERMQAMMAACFPLVQKESD